MASIKAITRDSYGITGIVDTIAWAEADGTLKAFKMLFDGKLMVFDAEDICKELAKLDGGKANAR